MKSLLALGRGHLIRFLQNCLLLNLSLHQHRCLKRSDTLPLKSSHELKSRPSIGTTLREMDKLQVEIDNAHVISKMNDLRVEIDDALAKSQQNRPLAQNFRPVTSAGELKTGSLNSQSRTLRPSTNRPQSMYLPSTSSASTETKASLPKSRTWSLEESNNPWATSLVPAKSLRRRAPLEKG